ncbi:hypothetical protein AAVH_25787 [Aphelenchoides avenae]|nr:hypothetical protein AAVH_25787 [Aphelenchus avenae]
MDSTMDDIEVGLIIDSVVQSLSQDEDETVLITKLVKQVLIDGVDLEVACRGQKLSADKLASLTKTVQSAIRRAEDGFAQVTK